MNLLSDQALATIAAVRQAEPSAQCALLTALRLTQQERQHVGVEEIDYLATLLDLSPMVVDGVARFYDQLSPEPVGRHVVALCRGIACYLRGAERIREDLREALGVDPGHTTADGMVTFRLVECIGDCDHAPAVMLDDEFLGAATAATVRARLKRPMQEESGDGEDPDAAHRA
jgi:NADH-quinone oxidoreductase subunit E